MLKYVLSGIKQCVLLASLPSLLLFSCESSLTDDLPQTTAEVHQKEAGVVKFDPPKTIQDQYIVVFKEKMFQSPVLKSRVQAEFEEVSTDPSNTPQRNFDPKAAELADAAVKKEVSAVMQELKIPTKRINKVYSGVIKGIAAQLQPSEVEILKRDERVEFIEQDQMIAMGLLPLIKTPIIPSSKGDNNQYTPYGIKHVGGSVDVSKDKTKSKYWAWIVDTGIDVDHKDLNVNTMFGANFSSDQTLNDLHGHGTHVAGILGAKHNDYGVTGVAAGAVLVPIKVLNQKGEGSYSDVVSAISHISRYMIQGDVVNLSIGGGASDVMDKAISMIASKGVKVVVAAGNDTKAIDGYSPARIEHPNVFTIGATDYFGLFAWFSNYGSQMDYVAPGVGILSTYIDDNYGYLSGTSMAAPHAAGVLLVSPNSYYVNGKCYTKTGYIGKIHH